MGGLLCLQSHYGPGGPLFDATATHDNAILINQSELRPGLIADAAGLITTMHLDQVGLMNFKTELVTMLDRGGRWFFNGHVLRPLLPELHPFRPIETAGIEALSLTPLAPHTVFAKVNRDILITRKGVAGFYGRGCNPMPDGATAITGLGPDCLPIDWDWQRPAGGRVFSHAGNDLVGAPEDGTVARQIARNIIAWTMDSNEP